MSVLQEHRGNSASGPGVQLQDHGWGDIRPVSRWDFIEGRDYH